jgi:excisionase family DNA binding protein
MMSRGWCGFQQHWIAEGPWICDDTDALGNMNITIRRPRLARLDETTMADKDDILLNSREVAFLLDLSPDTVNEFARRNILPAFKKGRQWRFRKRDIISFKRQMRGINVAA